MSLFIPLGYSLTSDALVIRRALFPVRIPLASIATVKPLPPGHAWRIGGVGGFFGSWGWFYRKDLGRFRAYITRTRPWVLIELHVGRPIALSPDDVPGFLSALDARRAG